MRVAINDEAMCKEARQNRAQERRAVMVTNNEESVDAEDAGDDALFPEDKNAQHFEWCSMDSFQGRKEDFLPTETGPTVATASAYEAFSQYWDEDILTYIVSETNRHAVTLSFAKSWYDTNIHEILTLFSFWMMIGIIKMPSIKSCFAEHPLMKTNCFRMMFTRKRYEQLCSALHFNNDSLCTPTSNEVFNIEPIINHLNSRFQSAYNLRQEICIDENLLLGKGQLSFRQYIKSKAAKFGIKTFELCESATGYLWSFFVYTGRDSFRNNSDPDSTSCVLRLIQPLLNKGHTLFMDSWFNSPLLTRFLKRNHTDVVGSLKWNRTNVPTIISRCKLQNGQFVARHSGDMTVIGYQDNRRVGLISTYHGSEIARAPPKARRRNLWNLQLVLDYNKSMGGIDLKYGMLDAYLQERKRGFRWNLMLFKRLLNCSILNSRICFEASTGTRKDHLAFRLELVEQILSKHLNLLPKSRLQAKRTNAVLPESRFTTNRHWPRVNPKRGVSGRTKRLICKQCGKQTTFECTLCEVGLCADQCFGLYHTLA